MKILPNQKIIWYYFEIVHIFAIFGLHLLSRKFRPLGIFDNWRKQCLSSWVPCAPQKGPMRTKNPPFLLSKYFYPNISIQLLKEGSIKWGVPTANDPNLRPFFWPAAHFSPVPFIFYLCFWPATHFSPFTFYLLSFFLVSLPLLTFYLLSFTFYLLHF